MGPDMLDSLLEIQTHQDEQAGGDCSRSPDTGSTVQEEALAPLHPGPKLPQELEPFLVRRCTEIRDRPPQEPCRRLIAQPTQVAGVPVELICRIQAYDGRGSDASHRSLWIRADEVLAADEETTREAGRERDLVNAPVTRPLFRPVSRPFVHWAVAAPRNNGGCEPIPGVDSESTSLLARTLPNFDAADPATWVPPATGLPPL